MLHVEALTILLSAVSEPLLRVPKVAALARDVDALHSRHN